MNDQEMCRLFQWFGSRSPTGVPLARRNRLIESLARSRWLGSSRHQALESPQLSATSMVSVAPLYWSLTKDPLRQNGWFCAPSLVPVQKSPIVTWTQRPQLWPLSNRPILLACAGGSGLG